MNEHVAIQWPELSLARELPFRLADTQIRPAALEIEHAGEVACLEPRVMKVLVALHRSRGQPVSRDELIDLCWGGRIVTEGALNRCVAQLRKALAPDARIRLDTIATVGYRLQVGEASRPAAAASDPTEDLVEGRRSSRSKLILAGGGVALAAAAAVVGYLALPHRVEWTAKAYRPLTAERGLETHPALSPDGDQLVYAQRPGSIGPRDLYLRSVGDGAPVRITSDPADDHSPAWSPSGDRIAFVRSFREGPCVLVVAPLPAGAERIVGRCQSAAFTRLSWIDERTLAIGDRPSAADIFRIRAVDVETGVARDITSPSRDTLGDGDPMASPDGRMVVFRRSLMHGADDLFLKDLRTGKERALTSDGWKAAGYVWSKDGRHIFYSSNRGGEFGLWSLDTRIDGPPRQISLGFGQVSFSRMSADRANRLAVEIPHGRTNIAAVGSAGELSPVTDASGWDWSPAGAADGAVAYVSSRSGASELWVSLPNGQASKLTSLVGSYLTAPSWSPDGGQVAFVSVKGRRSEVYVVDRDGARLRPLTADGRDKVDPVFSPDGRQVLYSERTAAGYRLMEVDLVQGSAPRPVAGQTGWQQVRAGPDGRLYGVGAGADQVRALSPGVAVPQVRLVGNDQWAVGAEGIYVLRGRREAVPAVWLHPWRGEARKLAEVPDSAASLGVGRDGRVLVAQNLDDQVDLGLIELADR